MFLPLQDDSSVPPSKRSTCRKRGKRKVTTIAIVVVVLFVISWLPIQMFHLIYQFHNIPRSKMWYYFKMFAHTLSYTNSCVNPFIYAFLNDGFKKSFQKTFPRLSRLPMIRNLFRRYKNRRNSETRNTEFETRSVNKETQTMLSTMA